MPYRLSPSALVASGFGSDPLAMAVEQRITDRLINMLLALSPLFPVVTDEEWSRLPLEAQRCFVVTSDQPRSMVDHHPTSLTFGSGGGGGSGQGLPGQVYTVGTRGSGGGGVAGSNQAGQSSYVSLGQNVPVTQTSPFPPPTPGVPFVGVQQGAQQAPPPAPPRGGRPVTTGRTRNPTQHTDTEPEDL